MEENLIKILMDLELIDEKLKLLEESKNSD